MLTGSTGAVVLLTALAAVAWLLRRRRCVDALGLVVLERRALSRGAFVATVQVGGRRFLIGGGSGEIRLLAELAAPGDGVSGAAAPSTALDTEGLTRSAFFAAQGGELEEEESSDPFGDVARDLLGVTVGVEYIEVAQSQLADLLGAVPHAPGESSEVHEKAQQLIATGKAKLLASGTLQTTLGQRAKIELVHEFIYPTEYDPAEIVQQLTPEILASGTPLKTGVNPTAFDARNLGMTFEVEPKLVRSGGVEMVDLNIAPELVDLARRIEWGRDKAKGTHPIFDKQACATQFQVKPGDEALAAIITPRNKTDGTPDAERRILILVWADLTRAGK